MSDIREAVTRAICETVGIFHSGELASRAASAAIAAYEAAQKPGRRELVDAFVSGAQWRYENQGAGYSKRADAAHDYADARLSRPSPL